MAEINLIATRRRRLLKEKAGLLERLKEIEAEEMELDTAERTLSRLRRELKFGVGDAVIADPEAEASIPRRGTTRPAGAPSTPAMIEAVLKDAGEQGLSGKGLVLAIRERFWPGVGWTPILPEASRLFHAGRLRRENGVYKRPVPVE